MRKDVRVNDCIKLAFIDRATSHSTKSAENAN